MIELVTKPSTSWRLTPLRYVADVNADSLPEDYPSESEIQYIDIGAVGRGVLVEEPDTMPFGKAPSRARRIVSRGDILVSTVRTYLRAVVRLEDVADNAIASTGFAVLSPHGNVDSRFLAYYCASDPFVETVVAKSTGVSYPAINASTLLDIPVPLPPLEVQRRVADMLDAETARIDQLIAKNKQVIETLRQRLQAQIDSAFASYTEETAPLGYLALVLTSGIDKHSVEGELSVRLCNYTDVYYSRAITDSSDFMVATCSKAEYERLHLRPGDVVMTKDSETPDDIAIPAIIRVDDDDLVLGYHNALLRVQDDRLLPDFLYWFLQTRRARDYHAVRARGVTRVGLRIEDIAALQVPTANTTKQHAVSGRLWEAQAITERLTKMVKRQIDLLETRRRSLITAAVTGQIDVATDGGS